jgi:hypothetical protein
MLMAGVLYRCVFCESSHEVTKRADGPVYLRCPATSQWAWYDARAFDVARITRRNGKAAASSGSAAGARRRARPAPARRRAPSKAKTAKRSVARASARKTPRKRGRR